MSEVKIFRSQLGGFNREDVNRYIQDTDKNHALEIQGWTEKNQALQEQLTQAEAETARLQRMLEETSQSAEKRVEQALNDLQHVQESSRTESQELRKLAAEQAEQAAREAASMRSQLEEQKKKLAQQEDYIRDQEQKITSLTQELETIRTTQEVKIQKTEPEKTEQSVLPPKETETAVCDPEDKNSPAYKISMYDKISSQLGDILIHANRNAEEILSAAKEEAERLRMETAIECEQKRTECDTAVLKTRTETEEEAAYIRDRLSQTAETLLSHVSTDLHGNIENCVREINTGLTDMQYEFQALLAKISARSAEMDERVRYYQTCVSEEIEKKLKDMDEKYGLIPSTDEGQDA